MTYSWENIASLYADERGRLKRLLIQRGLSAHYAADAVQEAFLRLLRTPREDVRDLRSYLRRTAVTVAIDHQRREKRRAVFIDPCLALHDNMQDYTPLADALMISHEELALLDAALLDLPPRCREVLILHKFEGLGYSEISERLGIAKNTVMVHMVKALGILRHRMNEINSVGE